MSGTFRNIGAVSGKSRRPVAPGFDALIFDLVLAEQRENGGAVDVLFVIELAPPPLIVYVVS